MLYNSTGNDYQEHYIKFSSINEKEMKFDKVFEQIKSFIKLNPEGQYRLMIGTDSQVHKAHTTFATGIIIMREGKGAWGCVRKLDVPRKFNNLHQKISYETTLTEEVAYMFTQELRDKLIDIVLPYVFKGATLSIEGHIDVGSGKGNKTRDLVREMTSRIESTGLEPKIKPFSLATYYANSHTK